MYNYTRETKIAIISGLLNLLIYVSFEILQRYFGTDDALLYFDTIQLLILTVGIFITYFYLKHDQREREGIRTFIIKNIPVLGEEETKRQLIAQGYDVERVQNELQKHSTEIFDLITYLKTPGNLKKVFLFLSALLFVFSMLAYFDLLQTIPSY